MKTYEYGVLIGRFQPVHNAHIEVIRRALDKCQRLIIVLGSGDSPRTTKNPFTAIERSIMVCGAVKEASIDLTRISIIPIRDRLYSDNTWISDVTKTVMDMTDARPSEVCIIGHEKDHSSSYLRRFPWDFHDVGNIGNNLSASMIRDGMFDHKLVYNELPDTVKDYLYRWMKTRDYENLREEWEHLKQYWKQWASAPYPPTFVTTDSVVVVNGHVLLVKRRAAPGKGLWALPGGFLDQNETINEGMIRELKEETKIKIPPGKLAGSLDRVQVFDSPGRSLRGRSITHAGLFNLLGEDRLPKVKGSDDAEEAKWVPLDEIKPAQMFEDHYDIITAMSGGL